MSKSATNLGGRSSAFFAVYLLGILSSIFATNIAGLSGARSFLLRAGGELASSHTTTVAIVAVALSALTALVWLLANTASSEKSDNSASVTRADKMREAQIEGARFSLEQQLGDLLKTIGHHIDITGVQTTALQQAHERLDTVDSADALREIVKFLVGISTKALNDTQKLQSNLTEAQVQTNALKQRLAAAERLASVDSLTGVANRRHFQSYLEQAVAESHERYRPLSLIILDIDHFKKVNDTFGHANGDAVIQQTAEVMTKSVRPTDFVARFGGEEFALILKNTPTGNALEVAERIRAKIAATRFVSPSTGKDIGPITASLGLAEIIDGEAPAKLIERADHQLYRAKSNGRNRVESDKCHRQRS